MTKSLPLIFALAATPVFAFGPDQAYFGIFVETHTMQIAGQKVRPMPKLPAGFKLPPNVAAMMPGKPHRILNVRLWSPTIAPENATASVAPPAGLGVGDKLDLEIYRPQAAPSGGGGGQGGGQQGEHKDFTVKIYWGSSDTVQAGQPKIFSSANMTPDQAQQMGSHMRAMSPMGGMGGGPGAGGSYFYKDGWSTAYWPNDQASVEIPDDASLPGTYALSTNYAGNVSIDAPSNVDFLAPIEITSPDLSAKPNLGGSLPFQWKPIPNALGQFATAFGMEKDTNTLILWSSSEVYADQIMSDNGFLQMSEVEDAVQKKIFMPGDATSMIIPAGIFKDADFAMMNMVGYGPGTAKDNVQPVPRIQTKTSLMVMLGGKKMKGGRGEE